MSERKHHVTSRKKIRGGWSREDIARLIVFTAGGGGGGPGAVNNTLNELSHSSHQSRLIYLMAEK